MPGGRSDTLERTGKETGMQHPIQPTCNPADRRLGPKAYNPTVEPDAPQKDMKAGLARPGCNWRVTIVVLVTVFLAGCTRMLVDWDDYLGSGHEDFELALNSSDRLDIRAQMDTGDAGSLLLMDANNHDRWVARESSYVEFRARLAGTEYDTILSPAHSGTYFLVLDKPCNCARHVHLTVHRL